MAEKKKTFSISEYMTPEDVSNSDTQAPTIELIDIDAIESNEANFYELSNLKPLADSILMDGLQQPLVVITSPDDPAKVRLLSGHRRRAAIQMLVDDAENPHPELRLIPCIRKSYTSTAMAELQLILANSTARELTSAEKMKQAEKIEALLYQLKEEGYSFPGRMRDQVAAACNASTSKLARLAVIRKGLIPSFMKAFEKGSLNESAAYEIARLYPDYQAKLLIAVKSPDSLIGYQIPDYEKRLSIYFGPRLKCEKVREPKTGGPTYCTHGEKMWEVSRSKSLYNMCSGCCANCCSKQSCKNVCPVIVPDMEKTKAEREEREHEDKARITQQKTEAENYVNLFWSRAKAAREASGLSAEDAFIKINSACRAHNCWWYLDDDKELIEQENGAPADPEDDDYCRDDDSPNDFDVVLAFADTYGCSIDYLVGRADDTAMGVAKLTWSSIGYDPPAEGQDIIILYSSGELAPVQYDSKKFDGNVVGWIPFPEVPNGV